MPQINIQDPIQPAKRKRKTKKSNNNNQSKFQDADNLNVDDNQDTKTPG